jgi:hypothetical protein
VNGPVPLVLPTPKEKFAEVLSIRVLTGEMTSDEAVHLAREVAALPRRIEGEWLDVQANIAALEKDLALMRKELGAVKKPVDPNAVSRYELTPEKSSKSNVFLTGVVLEGKIADNRRLTLKFPEAVRKHGLDKELTVNVSANKSDFVVYDEGLKAYANQLVRDAIVRAHPSESKILILIPSLAIRHLDDTRIEVTFNVYYRVFESDQPFRTYQEKWVSKPAP